MATATWQTIFLDYRNATNACNDTRRTSNYGRSNATETGTGTVYVKRSGTVFLLWEDCFTMRMLSETTRVVATIH